MSPRWIRRFIIVVFVAGIGGMIAGSIADRDGVAVTFGLVTAVAALGLILVTSVAPPGSLGPATGTTDTPGSPPVVEATAADVEARIDMLVADGADELAVRQLVARAIDLARGR